MEIAIRVVLILHFVGLSMLLGGALSQAREKAKRIVWTMRDGAYTQLLTGIVLVGLVQANDEEVNNVKVGVKLAIALVIAALCFVNRKERTSMVAAWGAVLVLTLANIAIAVLWN